MGAKNIILSLVWKGTNPCTFLKLLSEHHAKGYKETVPKDIEGEDIIEIEDDNGEEGAAESSMHGVINLIEARHHVQHMDEALKDMKAKIEMGGEGRPVDGATRV